MCSFDDRRRCGFALCVVVIGVAIYWNKTSKMTGLSPSDPNSFSRPDLCKVIEIELLLDVDFKLKILKGTAVLTVEKSDESVDTLILDTHALKIDRVYLRESNQTLQYHLDETVKAFGSKLEVTLPSGSGKRSVIGIDYETSPNSTALQWLNPQQTAGKRQPYLFSQCQAIHARSMLPCQDTPSVKCNYTAQVTAPKEIVILMSALRLGAEDYPADPSKKIHKFHQKVPIPSYLIAIVGGDLESRDIGPRSKVWSEKELVDKAAYEFAETEQMLQQAEALLGPYVWGQYDLLVLPPSFPYGGMENPCLTFVTPTLLAGDRSLADVVAHEISHSWTGNLVSNSNFEHFWLNEGHTVFVERKIAASLKGGEQYRQFLAIGGWNSLQSCVNHFPVQFTKLVPNLIGVDPDDAFSTVPYEKGFALLFYLESLVGGPEAFDPFLRAYIEKFKYLSIDTAVWKDFLLTYFKEKGQPNVFNSVDWDSWLYGTGMPPVKPTFDTTYSNACTELSDRWSAATDEQLDGFHSDDFKALSSVLIIQFLNELLLKPALSVAKIEKLQKLYKLDTFRNSEIRFSWLQLGLRARWEAAIDPALQFVTEQGRMKFVRPIYRSLYAWEDARDRAIDMFKENENQMHTITATLVSKDLKLTQ